MATVTEQQQENVSATSLSTKVEDRRLKPEMRIKSLGQLVTALQQDKDQSRNPFAGLPKTVNPEQFKNAFLSSFRKNPKLLDCSIPSVINALKNLASVNLDPDDALGLAYLVPYKDECVAMIGYKGYIALARRSGEVSTVFAESVYEGDYLDWQLGDDPYLKHKPSDDPERGMDPSTITHVYAVVRLKDGGVQRKIWTRGQVENHKKKFSQGWLRAENNGRKDSPWHKDWEAMAKKSVLRALVNSGEMPLSINRVVAEVERVDGDVIDVPWSRMQPSPRITQQVSGLDALADQMESRDDAEEPYRESARHDARPHEPVDRDKVLVQSSEDTPQSSEGEDGDDDFQFALDSLGQELQQIETIKECADAGKNALAKYAKTEKQQDLMVQLVSRRQAQIREKKAKAG